MARLARVARGQCRAVVAARGIAALFPQDVNKREKWAHGQSWCMVAASRQSQADRCSVMPRHERKARRSVLPRTRGHWPLDSQWTATSPAPTSPMTRKVIRNQGHCGIDVEPAPTGAEH